jgi:hypothetical protein
MNGASSASLAVMTEPVEVADRAGEIAPGIWHWQIANSGIGGSASSCHLFAGDGATVLIDPVQLAPERLAELPAPTAILLTSKGHQRSAWRYRRQFGADVWAPRGTPPPDEHPDHLYDDGDQLPGNFRAVLTPGPASVHYALLRELPAPGALVCADLLAGDPESGLRFVPLRFHDDPDGTRRSVERLLGLPFTLLCLDHGSPFPDGKAAIAALLGDDVEGAPVVP